MTQLSRKMELIYNNNPVRNIPSDIMHPSSRILFRFWEAARGEMSAAKKQDLQLARISKILANVCILERDRLRQSFKWRLAGTGVCNIWGQELTGKDVLQNWPEFEKQTMASGFDMVLAMLQPCVARLKVISEHGNELGIEFLGLPIQDVKSGDIQILASIVGFQNPDWLGTQHLAGFELSTIRKIWTESLPGDELARPVSSLPGRDSRDLPPFLKIIDGGMS